MQQALALVGCALIKKRATRRPPLIPLSLVQMTKEPVWRRLARIETGRAASRNWRSHATPRVVALASLGDAFRFIVVCISGRNGTRFADTAQRKQNELFINRYMVRNRWAQSSTKNRTRMNGLIPLDGSQCCCSCWTVHTWSLNIIHPTATHLEALV